MAEEEDELIVWLRQQEILVCEHLYANIHMYVEEPDMYSLSHDTRIYSLHLASVWLLVPFKAFNNFTSLKYSSFIIRTEHIVRLLSTYCILMCTALSLAIEPSIIT